MCTLLTRSKNTKLQGSVAPVEREESTHFAGDEVVFPTQLIMIDHF